MFVRKVKHSRSRFALGTALRTGLVTLLVLSAGCSKGCKSDSPYVPYSIADEDVAPSAAVVADGAAAISPGVERAPEGSSRWTVGGLALEAPPGMIFDWGVVRDFDADGKPEAVTIAHRDHELDVGQVLVFRKDDAGVLRPTVLGSAPGISVADARCTIVRRLVASGKRTVAVEIGTACPVSSSRDPSRWFAVYLLGTTPKLHFSADLVEPTGAPTLTVDVDGTDRDGDGIDDVSLTISLEGGAAPFEPLPKTTATLRWFDRPAGMSRDAGEPDASLRTVAASLAVRAAKVATAPPVAGQVRAVRALFGALCNEGGAPRLRNVLGDVGLRCGSSRGLEEAGLAEVRASATLGDALVAITALDRAQLAPATKTPTRTTDALAWIDAIAPITVPAQLRTVAAVPLIERGRQPSWGALSFDENGKLLVRTVAGVVRVDPDTGDETEARDIAPWPLAVVSPDGAQRFAEAYNPCDGVGLRATLVPTGDGDLVDVPLPLLPALGSRCAGKGEPALVVPLAWGASGLEAIVAGAPVLITSGGKASVLRTLLGQAVVPGSSRSPDGKTFVVATSQGILVKGTKTVRIKTKDLDGTYGEQRDCAVSNDGMRAACIRAGRAWVAML
ncbi:hypothetical protein BH09MYX1_BH09MYX1_31170 [soil metagenome]